MAMPYHTLAFPLQETGPKRVVAFKVESLQLVPAVVSAAAGSEKPTDMNEMCRLDTGLATTEVESHLLPSACTRG